MNLHLRVAGAALVVATVAAGCSSTSDLNHDPASADICVYLQRFAMEMTQEWIDAFERNDVTIGEWARSPDSPFDEDEAEEFTARRDALVVRWNGSDCAGEAFDVVRRRYDELTYTKPIGEYLVELFNNYD